VSVELDTDKYCEEFTKHMDKLIAYERSPNAHYLTALRERLGNTCM
jgi:hypothetical protein